MGVEGRVGQARHGDWPDWPPPDGVEVFRTGRAAQLIGYGMTRKRLAKQIDAGRVTVFREGPQKWAWVPSFEIRRLRWRAEDALGLPRTDPLASRQDTGTRPQRGDAA